MTTTTSEGGATPRACVGRGGAEEQHCDDGHVGDELMTSEAATLSRAMVARCTFCRGGGGDHQDFTPKQRRHGGPWRSLE